MQLPSAHSKPEQDSGVSPLSSSPPSPSPLSSGSPESPGGSAPVSSLGSSGSCGCSAPGASGSSGALACATRFWAMLSKFSPSIAVVPSSALPPGAAYGALARPPESSQPQAPSAAQLRSPAFPAPRQVGATRALRGSQPPTLSELRGLQRGSPGFQSCETSSAIRARTATMPATTSATLVHDTGALPRTQLGSCPCTTAR